VNIDTLLAQYNSALALGCLKIDILGVMYNLFLNGYILISFDLFLNRHHLNLFLRNNLFLILNSFLDSHVLSLHDFFGYSLCDSAFLHSCFLLFDGYSFDDLFILILDYFFLVGDVIYSALSCFR
jgi:hypothetical protein